LSLYKNELLAENLIEKYKVDDIESFLKRKNESIKFSQFSNSQSRIVFIQLDHDLKDLFTSFITSKKSISKRSNFIIDEDIIDDQDVTIDNDIITDDQDISVDNDIIENIDIIEEQDIIAEDDTTDENDIIEK
jgi:hypothetical protein